MKLGTYTKEKIHGRHVKITILHYWKIEMYDTNRFGATAWREGGGRRNHYSFNRAVAEFTIAKKIKQGWVLT